MKDIGLGIIDRYTVIIVLITLALAETLFGLQIPVDSTSPINLLWGLILFTGYLYFLRSLYFFPIATVKAWIILKEDYLLELNSIRMYLFNFRDYLRFIILAIPIFLVILPTSFLLILTSYAEPYFDDIYSSATLKKLNEKYFLRGILRFLDRLGIVFITLIATLPSARQYVLIFGIVGACFMLVVYLSKGNFTALLKDALNERKIEKKEVEEESDKSETDELIRFGLPLKISYCESCGKLCSENSNRIVPRFCSLECRQKWYPTWEKDWCIGYGEEREIINTLRKSGYSDHSEMQAAIQTLESLATQRWAGEPNKAMWSLLAMIRDHDSEHNTHATHAFWNTVSKSLNNIIEQKTFLVEELIAAIFDESISVVTEALRLIKEYQPITEINEYRISLLLEHESWAVRLKVIDILGKVQDKQALFKHLGKGEDFEDRRIIDIFRLIGKSAIPELKQAQKNPMRWIREEATSALNSLGVDVKESDLIEDQILCPKCQKKNTISFSKEYDEIKVINTNFIKELVRNSNIRIRCSSCNSNLGIKLGVSVQRRMVLAMEQASIVTEPGFAYRLASSPYHRLPYHRLSKTDSDSAKQDHDNDFIDLGDGSA